MMRKMSRFLAFILAVVMFMTNTVTVSAAVNVPNNITAGQNTESVVYSESGSEGNNSGLSGSGGEGNETEPSEPSGEEDETESSEPSGEEDETESSESEEGTDNGSETETDSVTMPETETTSESETEETSVEDTSAEETTEEEITEEETTEVLEMPLLSSIEGDTIRDEGEVVTVIADEGNYYFTTIANAIDYIDANGQSGQKYIIQPDLGMVHSVSGDELVSHGKAEIVLILSEELLVTADKGTVASVNIEINVPRGGEENALKIEEGVSLQLLNKEGGYFWSGVNVEFPQNNAGDLFLGEKNSNVTAGKIQLLDINIYNAEDVYVYAPIGLHPETMGTIGGDLLLFDSLTVELPQNTVFDCFKPLEVETLNLGGGMHAEDLTVTSSMKVTAEGWLSIYGTAKIHDFTALNVPFNIRLVDSYEGEYKEDTRIRQASLNLSGTLHTEGVVYLGRAYAVSNENGSVVTDLEPEPDQAVATVNLAEGEDVLTSSLTNSQIYPSIIYVENTRYYLEPVETEDQDDGNTYDLIVREDISAASGLKVELLGEEPKEVRYPSFEDAIKNMPADFNREAGAYRFTLLGDVKLNANITLPNFVQQAVLSTTGTVVGNGNGQTEEVYYQKFLDLNGKTFTTTASVRLDNGVSMMSSAPAAGKLNINYKGEEALTIEETGKKLISGFDQDKKPVYISNPARTLDHIAVTAKNGEVHLDNTVASAAINYLNASFDTRGFFVDGGQWELGDSTIKTVTLHVDGSESESLTEQGNAEQAVLNAGMITVTGGNIKLNGRLTAEALTLATSKLFLVSDEAGLIADDITVNSSYAGEGSQDYTVENNGRILVKDTFTMKAGTLENGKDGLIEADHVSIKDLNNNGHILSNTFTNNGKIYLGDDSHILVNETGTFNYVNIGDRFRSDGTAFIGRSTDAVVTFRGTFTKNEEEQRLTSFITDAYLDKIGNVSPDTDEYVWDRIILVDDNNTPDDKEDDYDADHVKVLNPDEVLFRTEIASFPVESIRVLPQTVAGADGNRVKNSNNAVYQSGKELKITGEDIQLFVLNAKGEKTWLNDFTEFADAVSYINALNNVSAVYAIHINTDKDIQSRLNLPAKASKVMIKSGKEDGTPVAFEYQGDVTLQTDTVLSGLELKPYTIVKGEKTEYKSTIDTRGKTLELSNVKADVKALKGTAATGIHLIDSHVKVDTKVAGINEITIRNGSSLEVQGGLSVNDLEIVNQDAPKEDPSVRVTGTNSILEIKTSLRMSSPATVYSSGSMKIKDIYSNCPGNTLEVEAENKIVISGRVLSDDEKKQEAWNKKTVIAKKDAKGDIIGYYYADGTETEDDQKAEMMPFAVKLSAGGGTSLADAPLVSPIWFITDSSEVNCFDFTHKDGSKIIKGTNPNNKVVLSIYSDENTIQEINRFSALQDAFNEIDKINSPDTSYVITLNQDDTALDAKKLNIADYNFPKQAREIRIVSDGDPKTITYKKDLKLKTNVIFDNVKVQALNTGTVTLDKFTLTLEHSSEFLAEQNAVYNVAGSGTAKGSGLVLHTGKQDPVTLGKVTNVGTVELSDTDLAVTGDTVLGDLVIQDESVFTGLGRITVANIYSGQDNAVIVTAPKLTKDKAGNIIRTDAVMTVSGEMQGNITVELSDGSQGGRLSEADTPGLSELAKNQGVPFIKAVKANPADISVKDWTGYIYKKNGVFVYKSIYPQVALSYGDTGSEVEYETFADAVTEINNLKTKQDYTIRFLSSANGEGEALLPITEDKPVTLTMPKAGCADTLTLTADESVKVYYIKDIVFNSHVILDNIHFVQVVSEKVNGKNQYMAVENAMEETGKYYNPVKVTVNGAYTLSIANEVIFNTPVLLNGAAKASLHLNTADTFWAGFEPYQSGQGMYIEGSVTNFAETSLRGAELTVSGYKAGTKAKETYKGAVYNVTELNIAGNGVLKVGKYKQTVDSVTVKNLNMSGGELLTYGNAALTNVTLSGPSDISVYGQKFNITGTVTTTTQYAHLTTVLNTKNQSVLKITGNVVLENPADKITVEVMMPDNHYLGEKQTVNGKEQLLFSNKLLTTSRADISAFKADSNSLKNKADEYEIGQDEGYILKKSGSDILVYYADQVEAALYINGADKVYNYYTSFNEAVAAIEARKDLTAEYKIRLINDVGSKSVYEKVNMPSKAAKVTISADNGQKICYNNELLLGCDTVIENVNLMPQGDGIKAKGINVRNWELTLDQIASGRIGRVIGDKKNAVVKIYTAEDLIVSGDISNINKLELYNEKPDGEPEVTAEGRVLLTCLENTSLNSGREGVVFKIEGKASIIDQIVYKTSGKLYYKELTLNGDIVMESPNMLLELHHTGVLTPAAYNGVRLNLGAVNKLLTAKNAEFTNVKFYYKDTALANAQWSAGAVYYVEDDRNAVTVYEGPDKLAECVDLAQASAYINTRADKEAEYTFVIADDIADTVVTDTAAVSRITLPLKDKMESLLVTGEGSSNPSISFTGDIVTNGVVTLQNIQLQNTKDFSVTNTKNSDIKKENIVGKGELLLNNVTVTNNNLKNITGVKNATRLHISNEGLTELDLKGGVSNIAEMFLQNTALTTYARSEVTTLTLLENGSWVGLGLSTIASVKNNLQGTEGYLGTSLVRNVPQMTITGTVDKPVKMKLYESALPDKTEYTAEQYTENTPLVIAKTEAAAKFVAAPYAVGTDGNWEFQADIKARKDVKNYVYNGDISKMEVLLRTTRGNSKQETYVTTYAEAVTIINNMNDKEAEYELLLRKTDSNKGVIKTAVKNGEAVYGSLALPAVNRAKSLTIASEDTDMPVTVKYTGTMAPKCDLVFENVILTEGKADKKEEDEFKESNFITPVLGVAAVTFGEGTKTTDAKHAVQINSSDSAIYALESSREYDVVMSRVTSSKGSALDIGNHAVYITGDASVAELKTDGGVLSVGSRATVTDVVMENGGSLNCKNAVNITNITGNGELAVKSAYTNRAWKTAVTQLNIAGELSKDSTLTVYQYAAENGNYQLLDTEQLRDIVIDPVQKPAAYQKLITAPKMQISDDRVKLKMQEENADIHLYKADGAVYLTDQIPVIEVKGSNSDSADPAAYTGNFFTWEQAVKEIDRLNHGPSKTDAGWNYTIILRESLDSVKTLTLPSKAAAVTIEGDSDAETETEGILMTGTSVVLRTDLTIKVPIAAVKKVGNNYYDTIYTLNVGNYDFKMNGVRDREEFAGLGWHEPKIRLTGSVKGTAEILSGYDVNTSSQNIDSALFTQISNVGTVTLQQNIGSDGARIKQTAFEVADGITNVGELILERGVAAISQNKDINVKKLTMGVLPENTRQDLTEDWDKMESTVIAPNVTVSDTLNMGSSCIKAGTSTKNDGKITLNQVRFRDNENTIEGKQDKNGRSQIQIKGEVKAEGEGINHKQPAVSVGLRYNNSSWKYVTLAENMILLTAPKAASSWFEPLYGKTNDAGTYIQNMGPEKGDYGLYKSGNDILYGNMKNMEVRVYIGKDPDQAPAMEFATFEDAVKAIDSMALQIEEVNPATGKTVKVYQQYEIELLKDVEIGNEKQDGRFKALSLPARASEVVIRGNLTVGFTGNVTLRCNTTFTDVNLQPKKIVKGEVVPAAVNFSIGNFRMTWDHASCGIKDAEFTDLKEYETGISNIAGGAKGELYIVNNSRMRVNQIGGLVIHFTADSAGKPEENECGKVLADGNVTLRELHYDENAGGILDVRGNLTTNVIYVNADTNAQIWRMDNKVMKVNGTTLTQKDENGKTVKYNESVIYAEGMDTEDRVNRVQVKTTSASSSITEPGTKIITGKYLDVNEWSLWTFDTSGADVNCFECNQYMNGTDIYIGSATVKDGQIRVSKITLNETEMLMGVGNKRKLTATITPADAENQTVLWSSSDNQIASVDKNGEVTAKKTGEVRITATSADTRVKAHCLVTVAIIPAESFLLSPEEIKGVEGEEYQLTLTDIQPADATYETISWESSSPDIVSVDYSGKDNICYVKLEKAGMAVISVYTQDRKFVKKCLVFVEKTGEEKPEGNYLIPQTFRKAEDKDDTASFNRAIANLDETCNTLYVPAGTYKINAVTGIQLKSNMNLKMDDDAVLQALGNSETHYDIILAEEVTDISISGGMIMGERNAHTGSPRGEWGMGIGIYDSSNIRIDDVEITKCFGDGIYIGSKHEQAAGAGSKSISITNCYLHYNRRNNMSIVCASDITVNESRFEYAEGTAPQYGIDIEPNYLDAPCSRITISNSTFEGNKEAAIGIAYPAGNEAASFDIDIIGCTLNGALINYAGNDVTLSDTIVNGPLYARFGVNMEGSSKVNEGTLEEDVLVAEFEPGKGTHVLKEFGIQNQISAEIVEDDMSPASTKKTLRLQCLTNGTGESGYYFTLKDLTGGKMTSLKKGVTYRFEYVMKGNGFWGTKTNQTGWYPVLPVTEYYSTGAVSYEAGSASSCNIIFFSGEREKDMVLDIASLKVYEVH